MVRMKPNREGCAGATNTLPTVCGVKHPYLERCRCGYCLVDSMPIGPRCCWQVTYLAPFSPTTVFSSSNNSAAAVLWLLKLGCGAVKGCGCGAFYKVGSGALLSFVGATLATVGDSWQRPGGCCS